MKINKKKNGTELVVEVIGRLDSLTSPDLEDALEESYDGLTKLILDLGQLEYISSAGLRVLLGASQVMEDQGEMVVRNLTEPVRQVIELVGFDSALNIE
jgi:anti-sigma B factor antagonist